MILSLRQRHRRTFATIGILLPIAFVAGIAARKPVPANASLPMELASHAMKFSIKLSTHGDLFSKVPIELSLLREDQNSGQLAISLSATRDFLKPDVIVYWIAATGNIAGEIPGSAILLGSFSTTALPLPARANAEEGSLVLFSLANQEIVDVSKPIRFNDSAN